MSSIEFIVPGDPNTLTGGYAYDREIVAALNEAGTRTRIRPIDEDTYTRAARTQAAAILSALPQNCRVFIDGLALAGLADVLKAHAARLELVAVMHHPAALETGLSPSRAGQLAADEQSALQSMHSIVCTSTWTARLLAEAGHQRARIGVVEPGVRAPCSEAAFTTERRKPDVAHRRGLRLLCVATLTPRKGHDLLFAALAGIDDLPWQLECIGSLERAPQHVTGLADFVSRRELHERIFLRGEVSDTQLAEAYARADVFVLASHLEGYGMVLAEARVAGLPIIATGGGAVADTLRAAAAIVVEPGDTAALTGALRHIVTDRAHWLDLTAAAQANRVRPRTWHEAARELIVHLDRQRAAIAAATQ